MPSEILQINATTSPDSWVAQPSGNSKPGVLNDNSDDTYLLANSTTGSQQFSLSIPTTAFGEDIDGDVNSITVNLRARRTGNPSIFFVSLVVNGVATAEIGHVCNAGLTDYADVFTTRPGGGAWTFDDLSVVELRFRNSSSYSLVSKASVTLDYDIVNAINAPSSLAIASIDSGFVELTWDDNSGVETGFTIQRSLDGSNWSTIAVVPANTETYIDSSVSSVVHYYYRVRASNGYFISDWSNVVDDTTPAYSGPALTPTDLVAVDVTPSSLTLTWINGGSTDSYELYKSSDGGSTWVLESAQIEDIYSLSGILPGATYSFKVRAVNTVGTSSYSSSITVTTPERSFRNFLEKEVLQETAEFLGWTDKYYTGEQIFTFSQTLKATTNLSAEEMFRYTIFQPLDAAGNPVGFSYVRGFSSTQIKLDKPLGIALPAHTVLWTTGGANDPRYQNRLAAKVGDTVLELETQPWSGGAPSGAAFPTEMYAKNDLGLGYAGLRSYQIKDQYGLSTYASSAKGTLVLGKEFTINVNVDYTQEARNVQPIYDSITNEALLRIGYAEESAVPEADLQKFRDAGRIEAWVAVLYNTVAYVPVVDEDGTMNELDQVFALASKRLDEAIAVYETRYAVPSVSSTVIINKLPRLSSSGEVQVRF